MGTWGTSLHQYPIVCLHQVLKSVGIPAELYPGKGITKLGISILIKIITFSCFLASWNPVRPHLFLEVRSRLIISDLSINIRTMLVCPAWQAKWNPVSSCLVLNERSIFIDSDRSRIVFTVLVLPDLQAMWKAVLPHLFWIFISDFRFVDSSMSIFAISSWP